MEALREIRKLDGDTVTIKLPPQWTQYREAEVIVLPLTGRAESERQPQVMENFLKTFAGSIPDFPDVADEGALEERHPLDP